MINDSTGAVTACGAGFFEPSAAVLLNDLKALRTYGNALRQSETIWHHVVLVFRSNTTIRINVLVYWIAHS